MNNVNPIIDISALPDPTLHSLARKILISITESNIKTSAFSLKDVTKAIANFHIASANVIDGDTTSIAMRNLAKEALLSVLYEVSDKQTIHENLKLALLTT